MPIYEMKMTANVSSQADERALASQLADIAVGGEVVHENLADGTARFALEVKASDEAAAKVVVAATLDESLISEEKIVLVDPADAVI